MQHYQFVTFVKSKAMRFKYHVYGKCFKAANRQPSAFRT